MVPSELDSPPTTPSFPSRRQFPGGNGPPDGPPNVQTFSGSGSPTSMVITSTAVASQTSYNTMSLVIDPSAGAGTRAKSVEPTASATETGAVDATGTIEPSFMENMFTPDGKLFIVGMVIIGLGVLTLLTCIIVITRCTLRRRRKRRTQARQRAQSQSYASTEKKRKPSADRASEFWSADAGGRTRSGDVRSPSEDARLLRDGGRPVRPDRTGEAETDLRAPGPVRVHFTPSVTMSDYTGLSMDVQQSGSVRGSGASVGANPNLGVSGEQSRNLAKPNKLGVSRPGVSEHRFSNATKWTLDPDPFAAPPISVMPLPTPSTAQPFLPQVVTFPPNAPDTPIASGQFTPQLSSSPDMATIGSSPSNMTIMGSSPSQMPTLGSSLSSNMLDLAAYQDPPPPMHRASTGLESIASTSDPFAYEHMARSVAGTPHMSLAMSRPPSNLYTHTLGTPPPLYIAPRSPGIQTNPAPMMYSSVPSSSAFAGGAVEMTVPPPALQPGSPSPPMQTVHLGTTPPQQPAYLGMASSQQSYLSQSPPQQSYLSQTPPQQSYLSTPPQPSLLGSTPPQPSHLNLQTDISQALSTLRRASGSTLASTHTANTISPADHRPILDVVDESLSRPGYFMHVDGGSPSSSRQSLRVAPKLKVSTNPESLNQRLARANVLQGGAPMYASPSSVFDTYYQSPEGVLSAGASSEGTQRGKPGSGAESAISPCSGIGYSSSPGSGGSPALPDSVRTSVLSYFGKDHV